jgi:transcriptional regulator with XRE-family HTH domain
MVLSGKRPHKRTPVPGSFGDAIRAIRERKGLTQTELGERTGLGQNNISRIETGTVSRPQEDTVIKLSAALGVDPYEIWALTSYPELPWLIKDLRKSASRLGPNEQKILAALADYLEDNKGAVAGLDPQVVADLFGAMLVGLRTRPKSHDLPQAHLPQYDPLEPPALL